ncbi:hypothetical protein [Qipengyuania gaetbuli]|uniref:hypothetical protein n=1 Tax=Qipengyuania gaetbuli TaxID=266952 RepID=UPI001CFE7AE9|nr:hypothetical protein [Qipengyuania gaetbuli]
MTIDRRLREDARPTLTVLLLWAMLSAALVVFSWSNIGKSDFPGPDDVLRLVQVRDLLDGQGWWDLHQYRIDPPDGVLMHWSRLVDVPIALVILLLTPLMGQANAELATAVAVPLLILFALLQVVARLAWRLFDRKAALMACLAAIFWPGLLSQLQPLRIDHHGWQILLVAIALWAISWRQSHRGGAVAGLAMAVGVTISLELLPMAGAFGAVLGLRWASASRKSPWLVAYMNALAAALVLLFVLGHGPSIAGLVYCDAVSLPHIAFFATCALGTNAIARMGPMPMFVLVALFAGLASLGVTVIAFTGAQCLAAPFGVLDPMVHEVWYSSVREGMPIWRIEPDEILARLAQALVALGATIALCLRSREWLRHWWVEYALLLVMAIAAGLATNRSFSFAGVVAAVPLGWAAAHLFERFRQGETTIRRVGAFAGILLVLMPGAMAAGIANQVQSLLPGAEAPVEETAGLAADSCNYSTAAPGLEGLPPSILFAQFDVGPAILVNTRHSVAATGHHRANEAMREVLSAFVLPIDGAEALVRQSGARYVVLCPEMPETYRWLQAGTSESLVARLTMGAPPAWLEEVDLGTGKLKVWRVRPDGSPAPDR